MVLITNNLLKHYLCLVLILGPFRSHMRTKFLYLDTSGCNSTRSTVKWGDKNLEHPSLVTLEAW